MKTAEQIMAEAPVSRATGCQLAFVCVKCPWWTSDWKKAKKAENGRLYCQACGAPCRELALDALVEGTREQNPTHFDGFIKAHSENWEENHGPSSVSGS